MTSDASSIATPELLLRQAVAQHHKGRVREAEELYRAILRLQPDHPDANHNLGVLAVQIRQPAEALAFLQRAIETNPRQGQYWLSYIDALVRLGRTGTAREVFCQAARQGLSGNAAVRIMVKLAEAGMDSAGTPDGSAGGPGANQENNGASAGEETDSPPIEELNALVSMFHQGRYEECGSRAREIIDRFPAHGFAWRVLANALKRQGHDSEALAVLRRAGGLLPKDADVLKSLAAILQEMGMNTEAAAVLLQVLAIKPEYAAGHYNLGIILKEQGEFAAAARCYRRAVGIDPAFSQACCNLGIVLKEQGELAEAEAQLNRALALSPDFAEAHVNLGVILLEQKRFAEAETALRRALELRPESLEAQINLSVALQGQKRNDEAYACCCRAVALQPDCAEAYYNLGNSFRDLVDPDQAVIAYEKAIRLNPGMAEAHQALGDLFRFMNRQDGELLAYQNALSVDPGGIGLETAVLMGVRYYLMGDLQQAGTMLQLSQPIMATTDAKRKPLRIYWEYLSRLISCPPARDGGSLAPDQRGILHVIGESHALSAHGVTVRHRGREMRCVSQWIAGCKQWHLGNSSKNMYKYKFESIMGLLPRASTVLLVIGEIDCRHDGGIMTAWRKNPGRKLEDVALATVAGYVRYVAAMGGRYGHSMIVSGVPALNFRIDELQAHAAEQLVSLVRLFNGALKEQALAAGMDFLDVHALTDRGDGLAGGGWHMDYFHLLPGAIAVAFDRHCIPGHV
ncbi:MAG: tetratricopeptide repeat protein [Thermodesulfobacteriota bacterium]